MSKIADALNNIQKNQENKQDSHSVFVNAVDEKLRPRSRYEAMASVMMILRPVVLLASVAVVLVVFSYGVRQGMKIEKAIANTPESAVVSDGPEYYLPDAPSEEAAPVLDQPALEGNPSVTIQPVEQIAVAPAENPFEETAPVQAMTTASQPEAPAAAPAAAVEEGKFTVQLITYVGKPRASEEVEKLNKQGYNAFIIPSGKHHQVCINRFKSKDSANDFLNGARKDGLLKTYPGAYVRVSNS